jgi:hypothetical protein
MLGALAQLRERRQTIAAVGEMRIVNLEQQASIGLHD